MRTIAMLLLFVGAAQPAAAQLRQVVEEPFGVRQNASETAIAQLAGRTRVKSKGRITAGAWLVVAGGASVLYWYLQCGVAGPDADRYDPPFKASYDTDVDECVLDGRPDSGAPQVWAEPDRDPRFLLGGVGAAVFGVLLATVWSEVDANDTVALRARPDGAVEVSKRINIW